jgi:iron complex transport system ATP-binding protein
VTLLDQVDLAVGPARWCSIVGANGAGKTTLLKALSCLVAHTGTVRVGEIALETLRPAGRARRVALVPQHPVIPPGTTVLDYVLLGRTAHLGPLIAEGPRDLAVAEEVIARLDLQAFRTRLVASLSGGERQRVVLARALAQQAPVLLLDEPTSGLDIGHQQEVLDLLADLQRTAGLTVVATMHDLTLAGAYADDLAFLANGRLVASGPVATTLTEDNLRKITSARIRLLEEDGRTIVVALPGQGRN